MIYEQILVEVAEGVGTVTLNRPKQLNAWTAQMGLELRHALEAMSVDERVRAIVLTGAGRGFCAGADMQRVSANLNNTSSSGPSSPSPVAPAPHTPPAMEAAREDFKTQYSYFPSVPKPIIAAINGPAAGLGFVLALYCDIRFAASEAVFTTAFSRRGLVAEHGIAWTLPRLVGVGNALDLLVSARRLGAEEALRMGLVNAVFPAEEFSSRVMAYARDVAKFVSPRSAAVIKRQVYDGLFEPLLQSIETSKVEMRASFASEDFREGVAHFVEKRAPAFTGR
jgi:enoyl-CoA hydratase/carnithine racemase